MHTRNVATASAEHTDPESVPPPWAECEAVASSGDLSISAPVTTATVEQAGSIVWAEEDKAWLKVGAGGRQRIVDQYSIAARY